jgi:hypothetical protein
MITTSFILGILGLLALHQAFRRGSFVEAALVRRTARGNWTIHYPDRPPLGEFATAEDASRLARLNGYEPIVSDEKGADDEAE